MHRERILSGRCYRCQQYGHSQTYCKMRLRCVRYGGEHRNAGCGGAKKELPSCALCDKAHPANYKGCEYAPKPRRATPVTKGRSSAAVVGKKPQAKSPERAPESRPGPSKERQDPPPKLKQTEKTRQQPTQQPTKSEKANESASALPLAQDFMKMFQVMWQQYLDMHNKR